MKNNAQNVVEKLFLDPFLKKQNWEYPIKILSLKKKKTGLERVFLPHLLHNFSRKMFAFCCCTLLTGQISLYDCFYFVRY